MNINKSFFLGLFLAINCQAKSLESYLQEAAGAQLFQTPSSMEMQSVLQAFKQEQQGVKADAVWQRLAMQRFELDKNIAVITEMSSARHGRGLFAVRVDGKASHWLLQAPHGESDIGTGDIARYLFEEGPFRAAQWNSVSRDTAISGQAGKADMAHLTATYWQAFTQAFAENYADGLVIQLHGFSPTKRKSAAGRDGDMIVSAGSDQPPLWVQKTVLCLKTKLPGEVRLYPQDVKELGGTTNAQGQLLRDMGYQGFMHIEMSPPMRRQLLQNAKLRAHMIGCLGAAAR